jgi:hypothetical protein
VQESTHNPDRYGRNQHQESHDDDDDDDDDRPQPKCAKKIRVEEPEAPRICEYESMYQIQREGMIFIIHLREIIFFITVKIKVCHL